MTANSSKTVTRQDCLIAKLNVLISMLNVQVHLNIVHLEPKIGASKVKIWSARKSFERGPSHDSISWIFLKGIVSFDFYFLTLKKFLLAINLFHICILLESHRFVSFTVYIFSISRNIISPAFEELWEYIFNHMELLVGNLIFESATVAEIFSHLLCPRDSDEAYEVRENNTKSARHINFFPVNINIHRLVLFYMPYTDTVHYRTVIAFPLCSFNVILHLLRF